MVENKKLQGYNNSGSSVPPKHEIDKKKIIILFSVIFILLIGCRSYTVGNDAWNYKMTYERMKDVNSFDRVSSLSWTEEPGYMALIIVLNMLKVPWNIYFVIAAAMYIIPFMFLIAKESQNCIFSITLFVLNGYFVFPMSTMRQSMAMGFCMIGFLLLKNRKIILCILFILIGASFHVSALISLLIAVVYKLKFNSKNIKGWTILSFIFIAIGFSSLRNIFINFLASIGREYYEVEMGGLFREAYFIITIIIALFVISSDTKFIDNNSFGFKALLLTAMFLPVIRLHPALSRTYMYFSIYEVILIPNIVEALKDKKLRTMCIISYLIIGTYLMYLQLSSRRLIPYMFFWNHY